MSASLCPLLRLCDVKAVAAWHFDAGSLGVLAESRCAGRLRLADADLGEVTLDRMLRDVLVLGDHAAWRSMNSSALRRGCDVRTRSLREAVAWLRDPVSYTHLTLPTNREV